MHAVPVIFVNEQPILFEDLLDRMQYEHGTLDLSWSVASAEEAVALVPESGRCIIVTESTICCSNASGRTDGAARLAEQAKKKNPSCRLVLYHTGLLDLDSSPFHATINALADGSYDALFTVVEEYSKPANA